MEKRAKRISHNMKIVDSDTRAYVTQSKIDALESDYYDSPNRLAEDKDNEEFELCTLCFFVPTLFALSGLFWDKGIVPFSFSGSLY